MTSGIGRLGRSRESVSALQLSRKSRSGCDSSKHPDREIRSTNCVRSGPVRPAVYGENGVDYCEQTWLPLSLASRLRGWNVGHTAVGGVYGRLRKTADRACDGPVRPSTYELAGDATGRRGIGNAREYLGDR